jgi:KipI family sensor histidine kinase inhibitor
MRTAAGSTREVRAVGDSAVVVDLPNQAAALGLWWALQREPAPGQQEVVVGARSVLVRYAAGADVAALAGYLRSATPATDLARTSETITIETVYDGADLDEVGELTGLGRKGVIAAHVRAAWTVAFSGFAPGFGYLTAPDDPLRVPRRLHPRTEVPAGAVGLAGDFSGIYPRPSPGGWQLIGRTDAVLWDLDRDPPALLRPGVRVRFVDVS